MAKRNKPNWQPISMLPTIARHIREGLGDTENQYQNLLQAKDKPYVLDDEIVDRVIRVHTTQLDDLCLFEQQVAHWKRQKLTPAQAQEIETLSWHLKQLRQANEKILALADELKEGTIDRILEKDDFELGLEVLLGKWKL